MAAIIVLAIFIIGMAALTPRFGRDSRVLDDHERIETYPGTPSVTTR